MERQVKTVNAFQYFQHGDDDQLLFYFQKAPGNSDDPTQNSIDNLSNMFTSFRRIRYRKNPCTFRYC